MKNDSIWATVLGIARTFNISPQAAMYDISYANAIMYSRATPMYGDENDEGSALYDDRKDANNPNLFKDIGDGMVVRSTRHGRRK